MYRELERLAVAELRKHLPGQHDQAEHGNWATGGGSGPTEAEGHAAADLGQLSSEHQRARLEDIAPDILAQADADTMAQLIDIDNGPPLPEDLPEKVEPEYSEETKAIASDIADDLLATAEITRANVNGSVMKIAESLDGTMHGLEYEMKTEASLERKLGGDIELLHMTPEEAEKDMKDVVRYTVVFPEGTFSASAKDLIEQFTARGFEPLKSKVTFGMRDENDMPVPGAAVNTAWRDPETGMPFEIQVHTPDSVIAKTLSHSYYDVARVLPEDDPIRAQLTDKMVDLASVVDSPPGLDQIPVYRFVP